MISSSRRVNRTCLSLVIRLLVTTDEVEATTTVVGTSSGNSDGGDSLECADLSALWPTDPVPTCSLFGARQAKAVTGHRTPRSSAFFSAFSITKKPNRKSRL